MATRSPVDTRTLGALLLEWCIVLATIIATVRLAHWALWLPAVFVIATRQHALLMLFHDAVHGLLARDRRLNDFLINLLVGVPHLLPVESYRPLHLAHHRKLGTDEDPERTLLYAGQHWHYRPLTGNALLRQLAGDLLLVNGLRTLAALGKQGGMPKPQLGTLLPTVAWAVALGIVFYRWPATLLPVAILWFLPLLTVTNLLQKLRSFAEHSGGPGVTPGWNDWTYSWRPGVLGRLTIWPYNINRHLEHHGAPTVPWHALPALSNESSPALNGTLLPALLHRKRQSD